MSWVHRFDQIDGLGRKILEKGPEDKDVKSKLTQLRADQRIIQELWKKKEKDLRDARELQASGRGRGRGRGRGERGGRERGGREGGEGGRGGGRGGNEEGEGGEGMKRGREGRE